MDTKVEQETKRILDIIKIRQNVLHEVKNNNNSEIIFEKPIFINSWNIKKIKAAYFTEVGDIRNTFEVWNAYVNKVHTAIGVKSYCEWIRDEDSNMIGLLAFYNSKGEEIKMKHFNKWNILLDRVKAPNKQSSESKILNDTFDSFKALLDAKSYEEVNTLMETYLNEDKSPGDIKIVLVITKSFKNNKYISETRKKLVTLLESKIGQKLV